MDSICITYSLNNEESVLGERDGDDKGDLDIFNLDENEYITKISGRFGGMIDSLEIVTNLGSKKRYGGKGGFADFEYEAPNNYQIIGFYGRSGWHIDAIGVIFKSLDATNV
ncbi:MAG TPA: jacalin-like lectin [Verrucomicrobiae bacterium]|nr:jacalin-like lectin [Verrucomicrobiae bacterium]